MGIVGDDGRPRGRGVRRLLAVVTTLVLLAGLVSAVRLTAPDLLSDLGLRGFAAEEVSEPVAPTPLLGPLVASAPTPTTTGVAAALDELADEIPGEFTGTVLDPATDTVLWDRDADTGLVPGSTTKLLTAAAALLTLDPTSGFGTRVVSGPDPTTVVLVGGGDPTLTALPEGEEGVYPEPARLEALADAVRDQVPDVQRVLVDLGRYEGPALAPTWDPVDVGAGFVAPMESLMLDGGRADPDLQDGPRYTEPAVVAAAAFAEFLDLDDDAVALGDAPADAQRIATVTSAPFADLTEHMLRTSDNVLAESLAREVALVRGGPPSFQGGVTETLDTLTQSGFDVSGTELVDGSGLATANAIPARLLAAVLGAAAAPAESPRDTELLRPIIAGLPVAGGDGTLDDRFGSQGGASSGRGVVRAKTGSLTNVSSLAGVVTDDDGRLLVFALMSNGVSPGLARPRQDVMAAALGACGCR